jgi:bacterioferritin
MSEPTKISREKMVELLNEDLSREYQAVIAYTVYSQTIKGAAYNDIANELATHALEELQHALQIAKQIDYFGGSPNTKPKEVKTSDKAEEMLRFDLENERVTLIAYRLSRAHPPGRRHGRIRPQRSPAQNHRPGTGPSHGPRRRSWDRSSRSRGWRVTLY